MLTCVAGRTGKDKCIADFCSRIEEEAFTTIPLYLVMMHATKCFVEVSVWLSCSAFLFCPYKKCLLVSCCNLKGENKPIRLSI